jgi:hypothetical protein
LHLTVQQEGGRGGQLLIARFPQSTGKDEAGTEWIFPRYGAAVSPGIVADIIRAGLSAGWDPETCGRPPHELDGEPFLRLPPDPTQPPLGSEDDLKRRFLSALREQIQALCSAPPTSEGGRSMNDLNEPSQETGPDTKPADPGAAPDPSRDVGSRKLKGHPPGPGR